MTDQQETAMIFTHTFKEPGLWRGWFKNGQSLELNWGRRGWSFGAGILVHTNYDDRGDRILSLSFWRFSAYIPLGITSYQVDINDEPQWSIFGSGEFGLWLHWGRWSRHYDWPWTAFTVAYEKQMSDGSWRDVFDRTAKPYAETYPYTYILRSGEIQNRNAIVSKRRRILRRRWGWWKWIKESIDVEFSDGVGERTGSWKGGTIGCGYDLRPGETMLDSLRRMERERKL